MKPNRLNLCGAVRRSLIAGSISTVKVVSAVNSELGKIELTDSAEKTGDGRVTKQEYKVSVSASFKYTGKRTIPLLFDAWHSAIARAEKIATFDRVDIPGIFSEWLANFKATAEEKKQEELVV